MYSKKELIEILARFRESGDNIAFINSLLQYPDKNERWLMFIEERITSPSTTDKLCIKLIKARDAWLDINHPGKTVNQVNEGLSQNRDWVSESVGLMMNTLIQRVAPTEDFEYSDTEKSAYAIIEAIQELEYEPSDELLKYIDTIDIEQASPEIQHLVNQHIYGMQLDSKIEKTLSRYTESKIYLDWYNRFAPEKILTNPKHGFDELMAYCQLQRQLYLIEKKDYFAYLLENGSATETYEDYIAQWASDFLFNNQEDDVAIDEFERQYDIFLPEELKIFYKTVGSLESGSEPATNIFSLSAMYLSLNTEKQYEKLIGLGIVDLLSFYWSNDKPEFVPETGDFSKTELNALNTKYKGVGYFQIDDNAHLSIYYDQSDKFGVVWYNQDDADAYQYYLQPMLSNSQANHTLAQLLSCLVFLQSVKSIPYEYFRDFILKLRK